MAKKPREVEIVIDPDGKMNIDQINFEGTECEGQIDDLLNFLGGKEIEREKKPEYRQAQRKSVNQSGKR